METEGGYVPTEEEQAMVTQGEKEQPVNQKEETKTVDRFANDIPNVPEIGTELPTAPQVDIPETTGFGEENRSAGKGAETRNPVSSGLPREKTQGSNGSGLGEEVVNTVKVGAKGLEEESGLSALTEIGGR